MCLCLLPGRIAEGEGDGIAGIYVLSGLGEDGVEAGKRLRTVREDIGEKDFAALPDVRQCTGEGFGAFRLVELLVQKAEIGADGMAELVIAALLEDELGEAAGFGKVGTGVALREHEGKLGAECIVIGEK